MQPQISVSLWVSRQQQWVRFHQWEQSWHDATTPSDRLASMSAMVQFYQTNNRHPQHPLQSTLTNEARSIQQLHAALSHLTRHDAA